MKPQAIDRINQALADNWRASTKTGKLTREVRADLLGVSVVTMERLLSGQGVDRTTIRHALANLGLPWTEDLVEGRSLQDRTEGHVHPIHPEEVERNPEHKPIQKTPRIRTPVFLACGLTIIVTASLAMRPETPKGDSSRRQVPTQSWHERFDAALSRGSELYHEGRYADARLSIDSAVSLARSQDSAAELSSAIRMEGDIAMSQGALSNAKECYEEALNLRSVMLQDVCKPPLLEALGDVETKMGGFHEAHQTLELSLSGFKGFNDRVGVAMASRDLGSLALQSHDIQAANSWFALGLASIKGLSKSDLEFDILGRQALLLGEIGRPKEARTQLRNCLKYWRGRRHPRWVAVSELQLGTVEAKAHHAQTAAVLIKRSKTEFANLGDTWGASQSQRWLTNLASLDEIHS